MPDSHTPGPWSCDGTDIMAEDNFCVATVHRPRMDDEGTYMPNGQANANSRLIAAAPELLAALKLLRDPDGDGRWRCDCDDPHFEGGMCENCVATAAIAKAEGRE